MVVSERRGVRIDSEEDIEKIPYPHEQGYILFARRTAPSHVQITYEGTIFEYTDEEGVSHSTVPDLRIENTRTGRTVWLELTTAEKSDERDPKSKQKDVMDHALLGDSRYVVLYRNSLQRIEKRHRECFDPFKNGDHKNGNHKGK